MSTLLGRYNREGGRVIPSYTFMLERCIAIAVAETMHMCGWKVEGGCTWDQF